MAEVGRLCADSASSVWCRLHSSLRKENVVCRKTTISIRLTGVALWVHPLQQLHWTGFRYRIVQKAKALAASDKACSYKLGATLNLFPGQAPARPVKFTGIAAPQRRVDQSVPVPSLAMTQDVTGR